MSALDTLYDWPEIHAAWTTFRARWLDGILARGVRTLARTGAEIGGDPAWMSDRIVDQTCGYPYITVHSGWARLIATPHYDAMGCSGPDYRSWIIVRADCPARTLADMRGTRAAYNERRSQSGYNTFRNAVARLQSRPGAGFFSSVERSGSHARSLAWIAEGRVDCAAIDAVCWALTRVHRPRLAGALRALEPTPPAPGLPFICSRRYSDRDVGAIREALAEVLADPALDSIRDQLLITGSSILDDDAYEACRAMARDAAARGYPALA